jgi:GNAT superfamily N-acetyltransferase
MQIRDIVPQEHSALGELMVDVYSQLEGFPSPREQPRYYEMLSKIGSFTSKPGVRALVAVSSSQQLLGGVVYFGDMREYGSGGIATRESNTAGIRLLGVKPEMRGQGVGKSLTLACVGLAREQQHRQVILHTTQAMRVAWGMYERLGFRRSADLDFMQEALPVYGFRLSLTEM